MYVRTSIILGILSALVFAFLLQSASAYPTEPVPCIMDVNGECASWHKTTITYHITNELKPVYADYYRWAFQAWSYETGYLEFKEVKTSINANIKVHILKNLLEGCGDTAMACTWLNTDDKGQFTFVEIMASNKSCGGDKVALCFKTSEQKFWIGALHEVGHSIGLDHVKDSGVGLVDIMYKSALNNHMYITKEDIKTLNKLYQDPKQIIVEMKNAPYNMFEDAVQFVPDRITIKQGETVTWINKDDTNRDRNLHTVTSGTPTSTWGAVFDSGNKAMGQGDSFSFTFNEKGEYNYLCRLHPWMLGKVIVESE